MTQKIHPKTTKNSKTKDIEGVLGIYLTNGEYFSVKHSKAEFSNLQIKLKSICSESKPVTLFKFISDDGEYLIFLDKIAALHWTPNN